MYRNVYIHILAEIVVKFLENRYQEESFSLRRINKFKFSMGMNAFFHEYGKKGFKSEGIIVLVIFESYYILRVTFFPFLQTFDIGYPLHLTSTFYLPLTSSILCFVFYSPYKFLLTIFPFFSGKFLVELSFGM